MMEAYRTPHRSATETFAQPKLARRNGLRYHGGMDNPLSALLQSSGATPGELVKRLELQGRYISVQAVRGWYAGTASPRDSLRPIVAEVLGVELNRFLRACAGIETDAQVTP